jgi:hypothetical protein
MGNHLSRICAPADHGPSIRRCRMSIRWYERSPVSV